MTAALIAFGIVAFVLCAYLLFTHDESGPR